MMKQYFCALLLVAVLAVTASRAQDYDDEGYGNQGGANGAGNQGDNDGYQNNYNDDGYSGNMPSGYQQNVDPESSNNNPANYSPQGGSDADGDYEGDDGSAAAAAASAPQPTVVRVRRAAGQPELEVESSAPKLRVKRHGKYYIGPVYTYVKTDKHANFKWGVSIPDTVRALAPVGKIRSPLIIFTPNQY